LVQCSLPRTLIVMESWGKRDGGVGRRAEVVGGTGHWWVAWHAGWFHLKVTVRAPQTRWSEGRTVRRRVGRERRRKGRGGGGGGGGGGTEESRERAQINHKPLIIARIP
jgi:hypothetical protein